jgi:hypothetical protein
MFDTSEERFDQLPVKEAPKQQHPTDKNFRIWFEEKQNMWYCSSKFESAWITFTDKDQQKVVDKYNAMVRGEEYVTYEPILPGSFPIEF